MEMAFAVGVFVLCVFLLFVERIDNTMIALAGAVLLVVTGILSWEEAIQAIDFETLSLLLGLMFTVSIAEKSGIFSWLNTKIATLSGGSPIAVFLLFTIFTALSSTFLNNVTVVILIIPLAIALAKNLNMDPKLLVVAIAIFSNIGGTLTLIGDPPNTLIGVRAGLSFISFIQNLWAPVLIMLLCSVVYMNIVYRKSFQSIKGDLTQLFMGTLAVRRIALAYRHHGMQPYVVAVSLLVLTSTMIGFTVQPFIGVSVGVVGLTSGVALALLTIGKVPFKAAMQEVEWDSLLFFVGLFVQVGALEKVGFLSEITEQIARFSDNYALMLLMIIWVIGLASTIINNIPFVALMIPVIFELQEKMSGQPDLDLMWWALALGACLGGNGTIIGSSAGYIAVELAKKNGVNISFAEFAKMGMPITVITLTISSVYLMGRLYLF